MANKHSSRQAYGKIQDTSKTLPRIEPSEVASVLGAEPSGVTFPVGGGPLSALQVRQELLKRLHSSGGRPSLSDTSRRVKIPLSHKQWQELEDIAAEVASPGFSPSAGQIASVLIALSLRSLRGEKDTPKSSKSEAGALTALRD
ncbi:MAG: hypothetical protein WD847_13130 [Pirellulales bacterium]